MLTKDMTKENMTKKMMTARSDMNKLTREMMTNITNYTDGDGVDDLEDVDQEQLDKGKFDNRHK